MAPRTPVVLDCDPGQDDAMAILLAARHLDLVGITTVHGNQSLGKVTHNARAVLALAGREDIPVHAGADRPLVGTPRHGAAIHGESGLDGADLPAPSVPTEDQHAVAFLSASAREHGRLTVVAVAPLTNLATALRDDPGLAEHLEAIHVMGGAMAGGNVTPVAEFNVFADPEAARIVFRSGVPIRMCGLDITRQAQVGAPEIARVRANGNRVSSVCADLLSFYVGRVGALTGAPSAALHDPVAVAWLIDTSLVTAVAAHVDVELRGELTRGMTVCDTRPGTEDGAPRPAPDTEVGVELDTAGFLDLFVDTLAAYG